MGETLQQVVERLTGHLADMLAAASGGAVRALPAMGSGEVDWQIPVTLFGSTDASVVVGLTADGAARIATLVDGESNAPDDSRVRDALASAIGQATGYLQSPTLRLTAGTPSRSPFTPPASAWQHELVMENGDAPRIVVWRDVVLTTGVPTTRDTAVRPPGPPAAETSVEAVSSAHRNLDVVLDLDLPITVRFGETRLTLDALARLGAGSVIDLERSPDDPVDLLVNGRLVARGDVVVVSGCYGVRIREVVSAADRLRSLEG